MIRAIIVDDEPLMVRKFVRLAKNISDLDVVGHFTDAENAIAFSRDNEIEAAFLDVEMPDMDGFELAHRLKEIRSDVLIVPVTAYESYIFEANRVGVDYYVVKPYTTEVLEKMMGRLRLIAGRQGKSIYIQTFGRFVVKKDGKPVPLTGKAKEILALVVTRCGKEIGNEEIYSTIWEDRPCDNESMGVYYNALRRLRNSLEKYGLNDLLISTARGQMANTDLFDCDFYEWKDDGLQKPIRGRIPLRILLGRASNRRADLSFAPPLILGAERAESTGSKDRTFGTGPFRNNSVVPFLSRFMSFLRKEEKSRSEKIASDLRFLGRGGQI